MRCGQVPLKATWTDHFTTLSVHAIDKVVGHLLSPSGCCLIPRTLRKKSLSLPTMVMALVWSPPQLGASTELGKNPKRFLPQKTREIRKLGQPWWNLGGTEWYEPNNIPMNSAQALSNTPAVRFGLVHLLRFTRLRTLVLLFTLYCL